MNVPRISCRQLERKWQAVKPSADLCDRRIHTDVRFDGSCPCQKERDSVVVVERRHLVLLFAGDAQRLSAGHNDVQLWTVFEQGSDVVRRCDDLFEVVEQEQHLLPANVLDELPACAECLSCGVEHELRLTERA